MYAALMLHQGPITLSQPIIHSSFFKDQISSYSQMILIEMANSVSLLSFFKKNKILSAIKWMENVFSNITWIFMCLNVCVCVYSL